MVVVGSEVAIIPILWEIQSSTVISLDTPTLGFSFIHWVESANIHADESERSAAAATGAFADATDVGEIIDSLDGASSAVSIAEQ